MSRRKPILGFGVELSNHDSKRSRHYRDCSLSVSDISFTNEGSQSSRKSKKQGKKSTKPKSKSLAKGGGSSDRSDRKSRSSKSVSKSGNSKLLKVKNQQDPSIAISGVNHSVRREIVPGEDQDANDSGKLPAETVVGGRMKGESRKEMIKKIRAYEAKKLVYASKIQDIQFKSDNLDKDLKVLRDKVKQEVKDLNALNREIDREMEQINRMNQIRERKMYYQKEVKTQQWANQDMATQHKVKTNEMQKQIGINIEEDDKNGEEELNQKNIDI